MIWCDVWNDVQLNIGLQYAIMYNNTVPNLIGKQLISLELMGQRVYHGRQFTLVCHSSVQ